MKNLVPAEKPTEEWPISTSSSGMKNEEKYSNILPKCIDPIKIKERINIKKPKIIKKNG